MKKLLELEEKLKKAKEELEKNAMMGYGNDAQTGMPMGTAGGDVNMVKEEHCSEEDKKADKKMIEEKMDEHNEKKHGEAKDVDSAKKSDGEKPKKLRDPSKPADHPYNKVPKEKIQPFDISHKDIRDISKLNKNETIKFEKNGQWSLTKGIVEEMRPNGEFDVPVKEVYDGDDEFVHVGNRGVDGDDKGKTQKLADKEKDLLKD